MLDTVIRGGRVIDGTGAPGRLADVGVHEGRIVALGRVEERARRTLDARGAIVAPGFVDLHTHYDAQLLWDGTASPSPLHGVTTVVGGNCGFSIAPLAPEAAGYLRQMLARVEGMPLESLELGLDWSWRSFAEYLQRLEGRVSVNAGFLVGHSALRRVIMGEAAVGQAATSAQLEAMVALLHESLAGGGLGFSSSKAPTHNDGEGHPVPSRHASDEEFLALARAVGEHPGTTLECLAAVGRFEEKDMAFMASLSRAANRPLNWNVMVPSAMNPGLHLNQLAASDYAAEHGARVVALTLPQVMRIRLNLRSGFVFDALPGWADIIGLPLAERMRALHEPSVRERMRKGLEAPEAGVFGGLLNPERLRVSETLRAEHRELEGHTLGELARQRGRDAFDLMLDLALAEDLRTSFMPFIPEDSAESLALKAAVWRDPRTVIGASDAGAHLDMIDTFSYSSWLLGSAVREHGLLSLEEAVQQLTEVPACLYGIRDRGRIAPGAWADLAIFEADRVGPRIPYTRRDLPGGAGRIYGECEGMRWVLVNGEEIVVDGEFTGARPGAVLRSGRDTDTVEVRATNQPEESQC